MKIVLGTGNPSKVFEINKITNDPNIEFVSPEGEFNPEETGSTFEENSYIKAKAAYDLNHRMSLADDSGLCIEALNGAPGLYSARYAGTQKAKIERVLKELEGKENRKAKFVCCMTLLDENGEVIHVSKGECHGKIMTKPSGSNGFGYDPIFRPDGYDVTIAQMSEDEKNAISHRGNAMRDMIKFLRSL
ncbi:TPA: non-canonical purine NTP pyrophosphatase, RdgB/HAM1 family [Candidatus Gastranaerophilales bacterium HUM_9]|nr:MAG TPA: non-canonical purine NTP pyrophosphatase, RdgB/HAM1 family [Candidatus Gastranaerophilales bacterium HUM_9]HBX35336.1 non-canonical purine NTP pyrophosphatase, RdgB/HAM1 family [Cyanobacteria bacterium UBA11440]